MRVVIESLGHAAAIMREAALKAILRPGATEIELAEGSEQLALQADSDARTDDGRSDCGWCCGIRSRWRP